MRFIKELTSLNKIDILLWFVSISVIVIGYIVSPTVDVYSFIASLIGVSALIFISKGLVLGQILTVIFSIFYGIVSYYFAYYGEMITYLGMTTPIAIASIISWIKNTQQNSLEVKIEKLNKKSIIILTFSSIVVTIIFYFILKSLNTSSLIISTISVLTSFVAASLSFLRSPYYAIGYAVNDIVLIILWIIASKEDPSVISMVLCFVMFLINDLYGFFNWKKRQIKQSNS